MRNVKWLLVVLGIVGIVGVRVVEDALFYDPFLDFFRGIASTNNFPEYNLWKLILSHVFRFILNLVFSALILQGFFKNSVWTKQGILLMLIVFAFVLPLYIYCVVTQFSVGELFSFYVRRFLIQPLVLIVLVPMFYYRKNLESKV